MATRYTVPPEIDIDALRVQAARRRAALTAHGCSTYQIGVRGGTPGIIYLCCGLGSSSPRDIQNRYCGFCKAFHSEWQEEDDAPQ
jgi:hypothetical protein